MVRVLREIATQHSCSTYYQTWGEEKERERER